MALGLACLIEAPLLFYLQHTTAAEARASLPIQIVGWYHAAAYMFANAVLILWNPVSAAPRASSGIVEDITLFAFQVGITTPIIYAVIRLAARAGWLQSRQW